MRVSKKNFDHVWEHIACTSKPNHCWYACVDEAGLVIIDVENHNGELSTLITRVLAAKQVRKP